MTQAAHIINDKAAIRWGLGILLFFFVGFGGWAAFAPLSAAVVGTGFVKVDSNRKTIQHLEGGIIRQILVKDGDRVKQGQALVVLQSAQVSTSVEMIRDALNGERAKEARLIAEKEMGRLKFPVDLLALEHEPKVARVLHTEEQLFNARRLALNNQIELIRRQMSEMQNEIRSTASQVKAEERAIGYMKEELRSNEALVEKGFIQRTRLMNLQRDLSVKEADQQEHIAELSRAKQKLLELERQIVSFRSDYAQKAANDLESTTQKIHDLQERLLPSEDELRRQNIVAPEDGTVFGLRFHTVGGVVGPKEPILDLVPDNQMLIVESHIAVDDVAEVKLGMPADIRFTAYKQRSTALVEGKVSYVSPDRVTNSENKAPYYTVHVEIQRESLNRAPEIQPSSGMPAEVFLKTKSRTMLDYLMAPITSTLRKSLRES